MKKKILTATALVLSAVILVVCTVLATIAYLTASSGVSNVFTVGDVSIEMYETKVDANGKFTAEREKVDSNSYHLYPDKTYDKDPTIRITTKNDQDQMFLYVKSSNQIRLAESGNNGGTELTMRQQMHEYGWVEYVTSGDGVEIVWVYGTRNADGTIIPLPVDRTYQQKKDGVNVGEKGTIRLCDNFTIHKDANVSLYGGAAVTFTAFAIQNSEVDNVHNGWTLIKDTYPYACGIASPVNPYDSTADPYAPVPVTP